MVAEPRSAPLDDEGRPVAVTTVHTTARPPAGHGASDETVEIPRAYNLRLDRVRWGPVLAGVFTALSAMLLLGLLGLAWTLTVANTAPPTRGTVLPSGTGVGSAIWGAISGIVAFFAGGYLAGWSAAAFDRRWGALNGALVFLVGLPVLIWFASLGLGTVLGNAGTLGNVLNVAPNVAPLGPADFARAATEVRNAAWWTLLGLVLTLGAAAFGGMSGTRREIAVEPGQVDRRD